MQAAVLGGGVPAAPMQEAKAALGAAGAQMATNQRLTGVLELGVNAKGVVRGGGMHMAAPRAPGEVAISAAAGDSSDDVVDTAAAVGLVVPGQTFPVTAAAGSNGHNSLGSGVSGGGQGGRASANLHTDEAAGCSAGRGPATALLVGESFTSLQGMAGCAEGVGSSHMIAVAPDPCSPAAVGTNGVARFQLLRPEHGRDEHAAAPHPLPTATTTAAAAADLPPPVAVTLAGDVGVSRDDNSTPKQTTSVQDAALEVLDLCTTLKVSVFTRGRVLWLLSAC